MSEWDSVPLAELCQISLGRTPPRKTKEYWDDSNSSGLTWLSISDLPLAPMSEVSVSKESLTQEGANLVPLVPRGTLLMSFKLSVGRTAFAGCDLRTNEAIAAFTDLDVARIDQRFLAHVLTSMNWEEEQRGQEKLMGVTLNKEKLKATKIPLPPLDEQKRIVAKLDKVTREVSQIQSLQMQQRNNIDALWTASMTEKLDGQSASEAPEPTVTGWPLKRLVEVADVEYGTRVTRKRDGGSEYPVYGGGGETFRIDSWNRRDCYIVSRFAMSEECVRHVSGRFFLNDSGLTVTTSDAQNLDQGFLDIFLLSQSQNIYALSRGTAQRNLDVPAFRQLEIPLPPLDEQKRIVAELDVIRETIETLREQVDSQMQQYQSFRSAVLAQAVSVS